MSGKACPRATTMGRNRFSLGPNAERLPEVDTGYRRFEDLDDWMVC